MIQNKCVVQRAERRDMSPHEALLRPESEVAGEYGMNACYRARERHAPKAQVLFLMAQLSAWTYQKTANPLPHFSFD